MGKRSLKSRRQFLKRIWALISVVAAAEFGWICSYTFDRKYAVAMGLEESPKPEDIAKNLAVHLETTNLRQYLAIEKLAFSSLACIFAQIWAIP